jgi:hypothetical protein
MADETEAIRRAQVALINAEPCSREALEAEYGQVWDTEEMGRDFEPLGFMAPYIVVRDRKTGTKGSLMFQHRPRFYFKWQADSNG